MTMHMLPLLLASAALAAGQYKPDPKLEPWIIFADSDTDRILKAVNPLNAYQRPDLPLRVDNNYGNTPEDMEPYGGVKPYKRHFLTQMEYTGPGRAAPEPGPDLKSVRVGFIGPIMSTVSVATGGKSHEEALGIKMLQGARLAIEEANARGGYLQRKIPFELVTSNDNGLWGATGNEVISMTYKEGVWAILGTIDGANSHIAIRVALKAELVMMNSGDTDPTFIETNIPWVMRCIGDDRQMGYLLIDYIIRKMDHKRIGIVRSSNRYGRFGVREIRDGARRLRRPVVVEMAYRVGSTDFKLQLDRLKAAHVDAIVHWGDAVEGARVLNQMRAEGMTQPFFGCDRTVSGQFTEIAGANAEGVIAGYPWNPDRKDPKYLAFQSRFRTRFGQDPETYAAHGYDGMNMLIQAIQAGGLNRAKIRDLLAYRSKPFPGVTGDIPLSGVLDDIGEVFLARFEGGRWRYYSREDLQVPKPAIPRRTPEGVSLRASTRPEILIGYFGPADGNHPDGGTLWQGASLAIEEANHAGGYNGSPFRLSARWSEDPWRGGAAQVTRMVYQDGVWAIVGSIEGAGTHLAEQVVAKALLGLVNPVASDRSIHLAGVPWMFSTVQGDHAHSALLADALRGRSVAILSSTDHDSRAFVAQLRTAFTRTGISIKRHIEFEASRQDLAETARMAAGGGAEPVAVIASARVSARAVKALRATGFSGTIAGTPCFGRASFAAEAGAAAEGGLFPWVGEPAGAFQERFAARFGTRPDYAAAGAFDSVSLVVAAIRRSGLDHARIRRALAAMATYDGASGRIEWDRFGQNRRPPVLATIHSGLPRAAGVGFTAD